MRNEKLNSTSEQKGFLKLIILIIIALIILGYFHIDVRGVVNSPQSQANLSYGFETAKEVWHEISAITLRLFNNLLDLLHELKSILIG